MNSDIVHAADGVPEARKDAEKTAMARFTQVNEPWIGEIPAECELRGD